MFRYPIGRDAFGTLPTNVRALISGQAANRELCQKTRNRRKSIISAQLRHNVFYKYLFFLILLHYSFLTKHKSSSKKVIIHMFGGQIRRDDEERARCSPTAIAEPPDMRPDLEGCQAPEPEFPLAAN